MSILAIPPRARAGGLPPGRLLLRWRISRAPAPRLNLANAGGGARRSYALEPPRSPAALLDSPPVRAALAWAAQLHALADQHEPELRAFAERIAEHARPAVVTVPRER